jgi:RNA polymerase sigma-70 factor (ECF subfamily)
MLVIVGDVTGTEAALDAAGYALKLMQSEKGDSLDALLKRARAGDLDAFEDIIRTHEKQVFRLAYRLLGNVPDAQDAAQEVFLKLHRSIATFDEVRDFRPWLNRVTANACTDALRRRKSAVPLDQAAPTIHDVDPERATDLEQRRRLLRQSIEQLPPRQRAAVVLRDIEGLSTAEVAAALGSTEATVRSHIAAARVNLRSMLGSVLRRRS